MNDRELREAFRSRLDRLLPELPLRDIKHNAPLTRSARGIRADMVATAKVGTLTKKLVFEFKTRGFPAELERGIAELKSLTASGAGYVPVLAVPFLSESGQQLLRSKGINYLDLSGNVFIAFDHVLIHKKAPANLYATRREGIDIFADKASLVLRALIADPDRYHTVRGLAEVTGNSIGWTSEVLREAEERGFLERRPRRGCRLRRMRYLLGEWTERYAFPGKNRMKNYFIKAESLPETLELLRKLELPPQVDYALTLHAGAYLLSPFTRFNECHLYVGGLWDFEEQARFFASRLGLAELDVGGNLHIVKPYYRTSALYGARSVEGLRVVSDLQLYLDLYRFPARGREQAERVLERSGLPEKEGWE